MRCFLAIALWIVSTAAAFAAPGAQPSLEGLDQFIAQTMKDWKVPGLAIAVVQDGQVIFSKGYGLRNVKENRPVTPQTLFAIGSITKSFTVTTLGILAAAGKLDWDKPVREYMPDFRLYDEAATERVTPRDLVTHRSGLPRHDLLWYNSALSRMEMYRRLRRLEPSKDLRAAFQYNNLMFMTAGILAGRLADMSWEECVRRKILLPLGMKSTNFSVTDSQKAADFALPYSKVKEEVKQVPFRNIDEVGPAGSINSNVEDMAQYLLLHLNQGKYGPNRILSENNAVQMQTPQMVNQSAIRYRELGHTSYGMAFGISAYRGHKVVEHGGGIDGFTALLSFLPQDKMGVVVLTNLSGQPLPQIVAYNVYDRLLGLDPVAWNERFQKDRAQGEESENEAKKRGFTPRKSGTHPSHELKEYAGEYEHPGYGIVKIDLAQDDLALTFNRMSSPLKHFHYDVFEIPENPLDPLEKIKASFHTNLNGDIDTLLLPLEPTVKEIVFTRLPDRQMRERSFLEPLAGQYELAGTTLTVSLKGDQALVLSLPGQPERELVPKRGLTFDVSGLTGYSLEFHKDASGHVAELVSYQPSGTFVIKRK